MLKTELKEAKKGSLLLQVVLTGIISLEQSNQAIMGKIFKVEKEYKDIVKRFEETYQIDIMGLNIHNKAVNMFSTNNKSSTFMQRKKGGQKFQE